MQNDRTIARHRVQVINAYGMVLRPTAKFVELANSFQSEVRVEGEGRTVDGKSILDMTTLAAEYGKVLDLEAHGPDAEEALGALADLVAAGFHMTDEDDLPQSGCR